jgi:hypothetical protein
MSVRRSLLPATALLLGTVLDAQTPNPPRSRPRASRPAPTQPLVLEGIVRGPDRKPIDKALVIARSEAPEPNETSLAARTDAQGRFRLTLRSARTHRIRAEAAGLAARTLSGVAPGTSLTIDLAAGGAIEGIVRDADTSQPAVGVTVETTDREAITLPDDPQAGRIRAITDAEGRFRLAGLRTGRHDVSARSRARGSASRAGVATGARIDLMLHPSAAIAGVVTGPDGKPVPDAVVTPVGFRSAAGLRSERTDAQGRYEIAGLAGGVYDVAVRAKGLAPGVVPEVTLDARGEARVDVALQAGARVSGRLVDAGEKPLAGRVGVGEVGGHPLPYVLRDLMSAEAGADGRFAIEAVPSGEHALGAEARGLAPHRVEFSLAGTQAQLDLGDVRMEAGLAIRGVVRTSAGTPVADATVTARAMRTRVSTEARARTDADGGFVLAGLEPVTYRLDAGSPGQGRTHREAEPGGEPMELVLDGGGSIRGRVVDDGGQPVVAFRVIARATSEQAPFAFEQFDAQDGRFLLKDVSPGAHVVSVEAPDRASATAQAKVEAGGTTDVGTVRLGAGLTLRGTVVDGTGGPVVGAQVLLVKRQVNMVSFGGEADVMTDRTGAFEVRGVAPGPVEVSAAHPQYASPQPFALVLDAAQPPPDVRLVMSAGGRIEGTVRRRDGTPLAGVMISVASAGEMATRDAMRSTLADGSFVIEHVPAGRVRVTAMTPERSGLFRSALGREVEVREDETVRVDLVSREILMSGRVTRSGSPAPGLHLEARASQQMFMSGGRGASVPQATRGPQRMAAVTREDGGYEMLLDEPGTVRVVVTSADHRFRHPPRTVEVPDADAFAADFDFAGVPVSGTVVDEETDAPLPYAMVTAMFKGPRRDPGSGGTAGPDGRFQMELDPGPYRLMARDTDQRYAGTSVDVTVGSAGVADVRIALPRGMRIAGRAQDESGRGVSGVEVYAAGTPRPGGFAHTQADGSFEIPGLRSGDYVLSAWSPAGLFGLRPRVAAGTLQVPLTLRRGGRLRVETVAPDGRPVAGAWPSVSQVDGVHVSVGGAGGGTNGDGVIEMAAPAGRLLVFAGRDGASGTATVELGPGEIKAVRIVLGAQ